METWNATDYAKNSSEQQKWARELIAKLHLRGDERVLDLGCGDGKVTAEIAHQLPRGEIVGVDLSQEMIDFAIATFHQPNLRFERADARALNFENEFDVVFSNAVLHWVYDHEPALRGIRGSLKPGGRILLQMGGRGNAADVLETVTELTRDPRWSQYFTDFSFRYGFHGPEDYTRWLLDAGFDPRRVELIPKDMIHATRERFAGWLRTTWMPWTDRIPEQMREMFIDEVVDRYLRVHAADADGRVHVAMVRLEVEATARAKAPAM
jgi:trans-aconitate methyltransferase